MSSNIVGVPNRLPNAESTSIPPGGTQSSGGLLSWPRPNMRAPDPGHEVAPVVEMPVGDDDPVHPRPAPVALAELAENTRSAVEEQPPGAVDQVPGVGPARVRPGGRAADDGQSHAPILPPRGAEDSSGDREAGPRRSRPGREDHRPRPSRRGHGGDLHGPPPDAGADRRDRDPGGRRRRRDLDPLRRPHDARAAHPRRPARERRRGRGRRRRRHDPRRTTTRS